MANRYNNQFLHSFRKKLTFLEGAFVLGATGDVGTTTGASLSSITRTGTGKYRITFMDKYHKFLGFNGSFADLTGSTGSSGIFEVQTVGNPDTTIRAGYLDIQMRDEDGTAANATEALKYTFNVFADNTTVIPSNE